MRRQRRVCLRIGLASVGRTDLVEMRNGSLDF